MSINSIAITQDNFMNGSDLLPVHSDLTFLVDVNYSDSVPDVLLVNILDLDDNVLAEYRAIAYRDPLLDVRTFAFKASLAIRSLMDDLNDDFQSFDTLVFVENMTRRLKVKFIDPDNANTSDELTATFIHAAAQFGESPNKDRIYNNSQSLYYSEKDGIVYAYFYNNDPINNLTATVL